MAELMPNVVAHSRFRVLEKKCCQACNGTGVIQRLMPALITIDHQSQQVEDCDEIPCECSFPVPAGNTVAFWGQPLDDSFPW